MRVELLHIPDCPNSEVAARLLKEILHEYGLPQQIAEVSVTDFAQAEALAFPGSPTIRVDGKDVDTTFAEQGYRGLSCRTYIVDGKRQGVPSHAMISLAIRAALLANPSGLEKS
jgi:DNA-binding beta-propeller fold protein YncE